MKTQQASLAIFCVALCCVLFTAGCAYSPVQLLINPKVQVEVDTIGSGYSVNVRGINQLPDGDLGSRGGIYADSSNITLANNIETALAATMTDGFGSWSFRPVTTAADVQVEVNLTALSYDSPNKLYSTKTNTEAEVQLEVTVGGATYYGNYRSSGKNRKLIKPSQQQMEASVNELLSATLQRAFADKKLKGFLQQHL